MTSAKQCVPLLWPAQLRAVLNEDNADFALRHKKAPQFHAGPLL